MHSKKLVNLGASYKAPVDSQVKRTGVIKINYTFQKTHRDDRPYLNVRVFGKMYRALLDSGASHTVIGQDGMEILDRFPAYMKPVNNRWVETADAGKHKIQGYMIAPITLEGRTRDIKMFVVPSLKQSIILGIDFWEKMQLVADIYNKTWEFTPGNVKINSVEVGEVCKLKNI